MRLSQRSYDWIDLSRNATLLQPDHLVHRAICFLICFVRIINQMMNLVTLEILDTDTMLMLIMMLVSILIFALEGITKVTELMTWHRLPS